MPSLRLTSKPGESMTVSIALWRTTKPGIQDPSKRPADDSPRERGFLERLSCPARRRPRTADKQFALLKDNPHHPSVEFKKLGERNGQEIWSARVTLKYRALAVRLSDEYVWFWIGAHNVYDALIR
jgi:hypothetical protein